MSVSLQPPNTLGFKRPLTELVKRSLTITNHNASPVAFKVKTTAPKLYCVRPNSGRVEPGESVEVAVMLQAMKEEPPLNTKCRDKFLIQSTLITPEKESMSAADIWNVTDDKEENRVHQQKLKVQYLPAEGEVLPEEDEPAQSSFINDSRYQTVRGIPPSAFGHPDAIPEEEQDHSMAIDSYAAAPEEHVPQSHVVIPTVSVTTHNDPPAPAPTVDHTERDLLAGKLADAENEIARLRQLLAAVPEPSEAPTSITGVPEPSLRRRRRALSDDGSTLAGTDVGTYVEHDLVDPDGVPLPVVIVIALGVFFTTYLFF